MLSVANKVGEVSSGGELVETSSEPHRHGSVRERRVDTRRRRRRATGFIVIANPSQLAVTANIAEADAAKVQLGQAARITFPATNATATGTVTQITPQSTVTNNVVQYPVQVSLATAPPGVGVGNTASLSITTGTKSGVLVAPTSAITTIGNRHTVVVRRGDQDIDGARGDRPRRRHHHRDHRRRQRGRPARLADRRHVDEQWVPPRGGGGGGGG